MKVALALSTGKAIEIKGVNYIRAKDADIIEDATRERIYKIKKKADFTQAIINDRSGSTTGKLIEKTKGAKNCSQSPAHQT
jgi:hypothetical protein